MLTPGIYYPSKNAHRQLLFTLPGKNIYPVTSDYIYYSEGLVYYVNQNPLHPAGDTVGIYINGNLHGTTTILDNSGLYVYAFAPAYGVLEVKSIFSDTTVASQSFVCVNLYALLASSATIWSEQRRANILLLANQYLTPPTTGIFRGQADQAAMSNTFGEAIGFPQPADWPFERYALAMGGYPALGLPGIYSALPKGSSVGAVKDIVQAVTQYGMTGDDFRQLQGVGWQLGHTGGDNYRYRYSGNTLDPVLDTDPTGVSGPHYFLPYNQFEFLLLYRANMSDPIRVYLNGALLPDNKFYARDDGFETKVWVANTVEGDHVVVQYTAIGVGAWTDEARVPASAGVAPICSLQSNIQQAYSVMLNVVHDGFYVEGDVVLRNVVGDTDYLAYNWLNPWAVIPEYIQPVLDWRHETMTVSGGLEHKFFTGATAQQGSEFMAVNGHYLYPSQYGYTGTQEIDIDPSVGLTAGDFIQLDYRVNGETQASYETVVGASPAYPYIVTLPPSPIPLPFGASVFVNGNRLAIDQQYIWVGTTINILALLTAGDRICVRYYITGLNTYGEQTGIGQKRDFIFPNPVDPSSVIINVNGERAPVGAYVLSNPYTVHLLDNVYNYLGPTDIVSVTANIGLSAGFSVKIVQDGVTFTQGAESNFVVNYTQGTVIWNIGANQPDPGTAYQVYYTYFPKQILERLIRLVQPATIRTLLQFTTTDNRIFNPYFFEGKVNPSGDVIA